MAGAFQDIDVAMSVNGHRPRIDQWRRARLGTIHWHAVAAVACDRGDSSVERDLPDASVTGVGNIHIAAGIDGHTGRTG